MSETSTFVRHVRQGNERDLYRDQPLSDRQEKTGWVVPVNDDERHLRDVQDQNQEELP